MAIRPFHVTPPFFMPLGDRVTSLGHSVMPPDDSCMYPGDLVTPRRGKVKATPSRGLVTSKKMSVTPKIGRETRSGVPSGGLKLRQPNRRGPRTFRPPCQTCSTPHQETQDGQELLPAQGRQRQGRAARTPGKPPAGLCRDPRSQRRRHRQPAGRRRGLPPCHRLHRQHPGQRPALDGLQELPA
jgi:hypothetical protein